MASTGSTGSSYGFAGAWGYGTDGDAGLMHVGARYYDPQVGRFASRDTVLTEKQYLYCVHDPVNAVDPLGTFIVKIAYFHCWIEYPGGAVGFYPGGNFLWGPGLINGKDPYGGTRNAIIIGWVPWSRADAVVRQIAVGAGDANQPGGGITGGIYQFPGFCCVQGALAMALYAVWEGAKDAGGVTGPSNPNDQWKYYGPGLGGM